MSGRLLTDTEKREAIRLLETKQRRRERRLIDTLFPDTGPHRRELYPKHLAFMAAGATHRERCCLAGNRVGKSTTAAYELACHLTGDYPAFWEGKRFTSPVTCWAAGQSVRDVRDSAQKLLLGDLGAVGTGLVPGDSIVRQTARTGAPDAVDTVHVRHASGGTSSLTFKTYEAGREAFQAATVHAVWLDEEPPWPVYIESLMRTATVDGVILCTFTPLLGLSDTASHFLPDGRVPDASVTAPYVVFIEWDDVPHLSEQAKAELLASIPPYLRDARSKGIPHLGSGAIYAGVPEADIVCSPFEVPAWWRHCYALDMGWNVTACVWGVVDPETDVVYLTDEYYQGQAEPVVHAGAIKARGEWIPGVVDPAARGRSQHDGEQMLALYQRAGLRLVVADNAVEAGIYDVWQRLSTGRLKVFSHLRNWLGEYRVYRRDEKGKIIKARDHCMDCTRYLIASGIALASPRPSPRQMPVADETLWRENPHEYAWRQAEAARRAREMGDYHPFGEAYRKAGVRPEPARATWKGIGPRRDW